MYKFAIMFNVLPGGDIEPIKWSKDNLQPNKSIIVLDESTQTIFLWHGKKQGLVARRTALRQADLLKALGYSFENVIIGMDTKTVKEIDYGKVNEDPETEQLYRELEVILTKEYRELEGNIVTFQIKDIEAAVSALKRGIGVKLKSKAKLKPKAKAELIKELSSETSQIVEQNKEVVSPTTSIFQAKERDFVLRSDRTDRLENIEHKLDFLLKEFNEFKRNFELPDFVKSVNAMKGVIKQGIFVSETPVYPSRDEFINEKLKEKKKDLS